MSVIESHIYRLVAECHFCAAGNGLVEADLAAIRALPPSPTMADINLADGDSPRLFVFAGDALVPRPCVHTVDLSLAIEVESHRGGKPYTVGSYYCTWLHAWLREHDPEQSLQEFAWHAQTEAAYRDHRPATLHRLDNMIDEDVLTPENVPSG